MKNNNALLAFIFFFLFALFGFTRAEYIYDSDGHILNNGGTYYIWPESKSVSDFEVIKGASISASSSSCSLAVVAASVGRLETGWATKITTTYPLNYITNDYPLNISFANLPSNYCTESPSWIVTQIAGFNGGSPVMVGKFEEYSVAISGYFYIKPVRSSDGYYKFAFCHDKDTCGYVIVISDSHGNQRLAVSSDRTKQPLLFKFGKASGDHVASGISMVV